ncbi:MAG: hypothetical protein ACKOFI_01400, partial [Phycisphaerales bacterium]
SAVRGMAGSCVPCANAFTEYRCSIAERDPFSVLGIDSPAARSVRGDRAAAEGDLSRDRR